MGRFSVLRVAGAARSMLFWLAFLAASSLVGPLPSARATITATGDVSPTITTWGTGTTGLVGNTASDTVTVNGGSHLLSYLGYIGYTDAPGVVTIYGTGSTWTNNNDLYVGNCGSGALNITAGGSVILLC